MRWLAAILLTTLAGCPICSDGELRVVGGADPVVVNGALDLELHYGDTVLGPGRCGGHWTVDGIEGGDATVGTIDTCGHFVAPATAPDHAVTIAAAAYAPGTCADCCPYGDRTVLVRQP